MDHDAPRRLVPALLRTMRTHPASRPVVVWLWATTLMLLTMIVVGGVTRLTGSGLSIVRWEPVVGALPPLSATDWERVFALYRETPQYALVNAGMDVEGFKSIFWWEYIHRLLGRAIGVVVFVPLVVFWWTERLDRRRALALLGIFCLGGLQGFIGWYMVQSGLINVPQVSHYRLTLHLSLGFLLFALVLWQALDVSLGAARHSAVDEHPPSPGFRRAVIAILTLVSITAVSGGLVAGLRAGHAFPTFPLMLGQWVPPGLLAHEPVWRNFLDSAVTVQFQHRVLAVAVLIAAAGLSVAARRAALPKEARQAADLLLALVCVQAALGITTLLLHVPVWAAAAHQGNAALLIAGCLNLLHVLTAGAPAAQSAPVPSPAPATSH